MAIVAFAEQREGQYRSNAFEAVSAAKRLADELGCEAVAVVIGSGVSEKAGELGGYGADRVLAADAEPLANFVPDVYARLLESAARGCDAKVILVPHTAMGRDLAPRVAARLEAPMASDVISIEVSDGAVQVVRPIYAGKVRMRLGFAKEPVVLTLRPKMFEAADLGGAGAVERLGAEISFDGVRYAVKEMKKAAGAKMDLTEADVIVSGGRGMKGPDNYRILEELAELLGGVVGASRAAVDEGWRPHSDQVGQTGKTVSPTLYVACGISGAIQHLAGMSGSKCIVAVNKDPEAPIFQVADYGIVGDLFQVVPALTEALRKDLGR